jgi:hypothetical protein
MTTTMPTTDGSVVEHRPAPAFLTAALCGGAAAIHLMMAPVHASASQLEAIGFAAAGWFQLAVAVLLVFRPQKRWFAVAGIGNALILAAWVWSRTRGLPVGSQPWEPQEAGGVDITAALFEAGVIVGALIQLLPKPQLRVPPIVSAVGGLAAIVVTTMVLVNPQTADHHGGGSGGTVPQAQLASTTSASRCDLSLNPVAFWREAKWAGTDTSLADPASAAAGPAGTNHHGDATAAAASSSPSTSTTLGPLKGRGSEQLDKLIKLSGQSGEAAAGFAVAEMANATDPEYEEFIKSMNPASGGGHAMASATSAGAAGEDHSMGHLGPQQWKAMTDPADCEAVRNELAQARQVAERFPTAADAIAAGYVRVAPYVPGIASHWMKFSIVDGKFDINDPEMLLYDGNDQESHLTGLSYYVSFDSDTQPTQGFTGENDLYHRHIGLCVSARGGVVGDSTTTDEECAAAGGRKSSGGSGWMSHAWVVPGCESPWGVFSGINPLLDTKLKESSGKDGGGCAGSGVRSRYNLTPGSQETMPTTTTTAGGSTEEASGR